MAEGSDEQLRRIAERKRSRSGGDGLGRGGRDGQPLAAGQAPTGRGGHGRLVVGGLLVVLALGGLAAVMAVRSAAGAGLEERALSWYLELRAGDLAPVGGDAEEVVFDVAAGEGIGDVARRLEAAGLIRDAETFRLLARAKGLDTGVQAGQHALRRDMSAEEVLAALQVARGEGVRVTLPEGRRAEEVVDLLAAEGLVERSEMLQLVGQGVAAGPAVMDRPAGAGLEGYLFPDTYEFEPGAGAVAVLERLLANFEARVTPDMRAQAVAAGLSLYEVVTLASIVERETSVASERPMVARVYRNRLAEPPYLLNADPTVQYGLGFHAGEGGWWKRPLLYADLESDSGYNTYRVPGLPPGPIASPGLASIAAVLNPAEGDWMYFVANDLACDGTHIFAHTYDEHLANVARYQRGGCGP